jgi:hypothetical protein
MRVADTHFLIHFLMWDEKYDEWIDMAQPHNQLRIAPFGANSSSMSIYLDISCHSMMSMMSLNDVTQWHLFVFLSYLLTLKSSPQPVSNSV